MLDFKQELVIFNNKNYSKAIPVTTSLKISEIFNKRHDNILREIRNLIQLNQNKYTSKSF